MEQMQAAHYGIVSVEIVKSDRRFQLMIPLGVSWDDAQLVCDEFKLAIQEMKRLAAEQLAKQQEEQPVEVEAAVVEEAAVESEAEVSPSPA